MLMFYNQNIFWDANVQMEDFLWRTSKESLVSLTSGLFLSEYSEKDHENTFVSNIEGIFIDY